MSTSTHTMSNKGATWLKRGNVLYTEASDPGLPGALRITTLRSALAYYKEAINAYENDAGTPYRERRTALASLHKAAAMASIKLAKLTEIEDPNQCLQLYTEAISFLAIPPPSCVKGRQTQEWHSQAYETMHSTVAAVFNLLMDKDLVSGLQDLLQIFEANRPLEEASSMAQRLIKGMSFHAEDHQTALEDICDSVEERHQDLFITMCSCKSMQAREVADKLLSQQMQDAESPNFDMVWEVVDMYKQAELLTREHDVENEAIALSRLGRLYKLVLKKPDKAALYYRRAFDLAQSLWPRVLNKEDWYQEILDAMQKIQAEAYTRDEAARDATRATVLATLDKEVKATKAAFNEGTFKLLEHVYSVHPPQNPEHRMNEAPTSETMKKMLQTAIVHYHPDKQRGKYPERWCVLAEEITKFLTQKYSLLKG